MFYVGQKINGKTVVRIESLRSGWWVYFNDGTVEVHRYDGNNDR
jgi:hypothetical protein